MLLLVLFTMMLMFVLVNYVYCDLESAAAGTVGQRAAWPHKNY